MRCSEVRENLSAYLEGEHRQEIEAHLAECQACQRELRELQAVVASLRSLEPARPPAELRGRIRTAVRQAAEQRKAERPWHQVPFWQGWLAAARAATLILLVAAIALTWRGPALSKMAGEPEMAAPAVEMPSPEQVAATPPGSEHYTDKREWEKARARVLEERLEAADETAESPARGGLSGARPGSDAERMAQAPAVEAEDDYASAPAAATRPAATEEPASASAGDLVRLDLKPLGKPVVGQRSQAEIVVEPKQALKNATVRAIPEAPLRVVSGEDNVIHKGDLPANVEQRWTVDLETAQPGAQELVLEIEAEQPPMHERRVVFLPYGPASRARATRPAAGRPSVTLNVSKVHLETVAKEIARQTRANIIVDEKLNRRPVTANYKNETISRALDDLARQAGGQLERDERGYHINVRPPTAAAEPAAAP